MHTPAFDPTKTCHKSISGAVAAGKTLRLRVVLPRSIRATACCLYIYEDGKNAECIYMNWESTDGNEEWWYTDFTPEKPSLYFYHFEYDSSWGRTKLQMNDNNSSAIYNGEFNWQLTVYDGGFKTPDWIKGGIIYQIFPDRFYNSGTPKSGVPSDRIIRNDAENLPYWRPDENGYILNNDYFGGDFKGITEKLGYIKSLGVNCIYLNPINEAHSNHRYDTADYLSPDPLLGTKEDFSEMCRKAHSLGIRIILDGVYSHTGADSIYFNKNRRYASLGAYQSKDSPYYPWYNFKKWNEEYDCWWNIKILPEVNENNPSFTDFITAPGGVTDTWLSLGADGIRLDVADELPDEFLDKLRTAVKRHSDDAFLLGEVWEDASNKISFGKRRRYILGKQLDSVMNYPFRNAVIEFLMTSGAEKFMAEVNTICLNYPPEALNTAMNLLGTHDTQRILSVLSGINCEGKNREWQANAVADEKNLRRGIRLLKMAATLIYTLPGVPSVYYGDEAGMTGCKDPFNRCCYPWGRENTGILDFYKELGRIRTQSNAFREGAFIPVSAMLGCVAYMRYTPGEKRIMVIANKNPDEITYWLNWDVNQMAVLTGGRRVDGGVVIPPETAVILTDK